MYNYKKIAMLCAMIFAMVSSQASWAGDVESVKTIREKIENAKRNRNEELSRLIGEKYFNILKPFLVNHDRMGRFALVFDYLGIINNIPESSGDNRVSAIEWGCKYGSSDDYLGSKDYPRSLLTAGLENRRKESKYWCVNPGRTDIADIIKNVAISSYCNAVISRCKKNRSEIKYKIIKLIIRNNGNNEDVKKINKYDSEIVELIKKLLIADKKSIFVNEVRDEYWKNPVISISIHAEKTKNDGNNQNITTTLVAPAVHKELSKEEAESKYFKALDKYFKVVHEHFISVSDLLGKGSSYEKAARFLERQLVAILEENKYIDGHLSKDMLERVDEIIATFDRDIENIKVLYSSTENYKTYLDAITRLKKWSRNELNNELDAIAKTIRIKDIENNLDTLFASNDVDLSQKVANLFDVNNKENKCLLEPNGLFEILLKWLGFKSESEKILRKLAINKKK